MNPDAVPDATTQQQHARESSADPAQHTRPEKKLKSLLSILNLPSRKPVNKLLDVFKVPDSQVTSRVTSTAGVASSSSTPRAHSPAPESPSIVKNEFPQDSNVGSLVENPAQRSSPVLKRQAEDAFRVGVLALPAVTAVATDCQKVRQWRKVNEGGQVADKIQCSRDGRGGAKVSDMIAVVDLGIEIIIMIYI